MILIKSLNNKPISLSKKNRDSAKLHKCKATTTFVKESLLVKDNNDLGIEHKQAIQKVMESSLYSKCLRDTINNFNRLINTHTRCFNNINKWIPVESFVGSSTGIFVSFRDD